MLISFTLDNFCAFREPQELSLRRVSPSAKVDDTGGWDPSISTLAAIYGANASGKSTLVHAIAYAQAAVRDSYAKWPVSGDTGVTPFAFDPAMRSAPTTFEFELRAADGHDYLYGFSLDRTRVIEEWLHLYRTARPTILFSRSADDGLTFGRTFRGPQASIRDAAGTRPNALSLSVAAQFGSESVRPVYDEIVDSIRVYAAHAYELGRQSVAHILTDHPELGESIVSLLRHADLGISEISVDEQDQTVMARIRADLEERGLPESIIERVVSETALSITLHHDTPHGPMPLALSAESRGTQALLSFAPVVTQALARGQTLVIDEIDSSLHPLIVRALVSLFQGPETNPHQAQLVFTTHDSSLLSRDRSLGESPIARDQLWVTEKNTASGEAELIAVAEYSPRKEENLERGYLTGRYGGLPQLRDDLLTRPGSRV